MTLSERLYEIEEINEQLKEFDSQIDVQGLQKKLFREYESNPILYDALVGRQTVTQSLEELAEINKGVKRYFPHRKNKVHNERVKQMGELVHAGDNLKTHGIFYPDNAITAGLEVAAITSGIILLVPNLLSWRTEIKFDDYLLKILTPLFGVTAAFAFNRSERIPRDETEYLDAKIKTL